MLSETVLIVDDTPDNLTVLSEILKPDYKVQVSVSGEKALKLLEGQTLPDLILLDIMMPGLDGYAVCRMLKSNPRTADIPVLFISALTNAEDISAGFQAGGIDYITKPFFAEEVMCRVKTHIELRNTLKENQKLLSKTLVGSIKVMSDLLSVANPLLAKKTNRLRHYAKEMMPYLGMESQNQWTVELAIMLSHIGLIGVPEGIIKRKSEKGQLKAEESFIYDQYPLTGSELIARIPRLQDVADMVKYQLTYPKHLPQELSSNVRLGASLINLLLIYDYNIMRGLEKHDVVSKLRTRLMDYPPAIMNAMQYIGEKEVEKPKTHVKIEMLKEGMVLFEDILNTSGELLLPRKTELTDSMVQLLQRLFRMGQFNKPFIAIVYKDNGAES